MRRDRPAEERRRRTDATETVVGSPNVVVPWPMKESRRRFLVRVGGTAAAGCLLATLGACDDDEGQSPATGTIAGGNVKDLAKNSLKLLPGKKLILGRDDAGVYAMTAICTHDQCDISSSGKVSHDGIECTCHNSRFDKAGKVTNGPAMSNLEHYKVDVAANGDILIQAGQVVGIEVRAAVPA